MQNPILDQILNQETLSKANLLFLMDLTDQSDLDRLYQQAYAVKAQHVGKKAYYRGLIEFSNVCIKDCTYCGIRKSNSLTLRFNMTKTEIVEMAQWAYENDYGSVTLQSGERQDAQFVDFVSDVIAAIKTIGGGKLGLTLCLGEQSAQTYEKWFALGAHRYLLRIETTNETLYRRIHPDDPVHDFAKRVDCLAVLKEIGYQVGTGVLIGLPEQTNEDLVNDILFFEKADIDMIGMGPYVVHQDTPMGQAVLANGQNSPVQQQERLTKGLKMIAITRLYLKNVNIASTTALQALHPLGREMGLKAGANILMPIITIAEHRKKYQLYDNKPCLEDNAEHCKNCLTKRVADVGDVVGFGEWGDSPHYAKNKGK